MPTSNTIIKELMSHLISKVLKSLLISKIMAIEPIGKLMYWGVKYALGSALFHRYSTEIIS
jgi:hypothetical protein